MLRSEVEVLRERTAGLENARRECITTLLRAAITEDLGLGFGWLALYFCVHRGLAWLHPETPARDPGDPPR